MYVTETHAHVTPVSTCSRLAPEEMVRLYREAGYDTLFITDHFSPYHFNKIDPDHALPFSAKVDMMLRAYERARAAGDACGLCVLFGAELSLAENHWLLYGVDRDFLLAREDVFTMPLEAFRDHARAHGVTMVQAHPLRDGKCTPHPEMADAFEVHNACLRHENYNDEALAIARAHGLPMTVGSDAHRVEDVGGAAVLSEEKITSADVYVRLLLGGGLRLRVGADVLAP